MADDITPRALANRWTPPEDALPLRQGALAQAFKGALVDPVVSGVTAAKDAYDGKFDPSSDEGIGRALGTAGLAMTGGLGGGPAGALGSGPIRAYHGSPHDFDRFDISKIGTGEGAQAYGHGLYFAENEGVAQGYRDRLTPQLKDPATIDQRIANNAAYADDLAKQLASLDPASPEAAKLQSRIAFFHDSNNRLHETRNGRMYEVNLHADPERLLDWDKPLSAQPKPAQDVLRSFGVDPDGYPRWKLDPTPSGKSQYLIHPAGYITQGNPGPLRNLTKAQQLLDQKNAESAAEWTGAVGHQRARQNLLQQDGNLNSQRAQELIAKTLREEGVPGIRYFDQGSRGATENSSRNYVMFDDKPVEIVRKYATGGPVEEIDAPGLGQRLHAPDADILGYIMNQQAMRAQGAIPPLDWAGDLSGVDRRRLVPPRPVKKADGGVVDGLPALANGWARTAPDTGYLTQLPPEDESRFQGWVRQNRVPFDPSPRADYDMRGFWKDQMSGGGHAQTGQNANDGKMHFGDYFKTPYHESFSRESRWATPVAPAWNDLDQLVTPDGRVVFDERKALHKADGGAVSVGDNPEISYSPEQIQAALAYLALMQQRDGDAG